jgi:hypothetical protein
MILKLNQKGSFIIWFTLAFALLGTFVGFAVDFGRAYLEKARIARLVDAASLAAAKAGKGQDGLYADATRAACDSINMNGVKVVMISSTKCEEPEGSRITAEIVPVPITTPDGATLMGIQVTGTEEMRTTFLRFLGWMVPGDYSTIDVAAVAQAAPERPIDLVLVLDRSGSMKGTKLAALKTTVNEFLDNNFTGNDRIGMVSFGWRGCGNANGGDNFAAITCGLDVAMADATSTNINTLKNRVNGLDSDGGTNTMEALRAARPPIADAFADPERANTRKVVLLVTDGKPTVMRRDNDDQCRRNPKSNDVVDKWNGAPLNTFAKGCLMEANSPTGAYASRGPLNSPPSSAWPQANVFLDTISCFRSLSDCATGSNGVMHEANLIRNCGAGNAGCTANGQHDVLVFAIGIGDLSNTPNASFDKAAKCMLLRVANGTDLVSTVNNTVESINTICTSPFPKTTDKDTYSELLEGCGTGPCSIDSTQEKGRVYFVDQKGNVEAQLQQVFNEIAALLKLRLTI